MRPPVLAGMITLSAALVVASFSIGRLSERRAQQRSIIGSQQSKAAIAGSASKSNRLLLDAENQTDHILVANVASVSFGELWDVMRTGAPDKRAQWAHEIEQLPPGPRR